MGPDAIQPLVCGRCGAPTDVAPDAPWAHCKAPDPVAPEARSALRRHAELTRRQLARFDSATRQAYPRARLAPRIALARAANTAGNLWALARPVALFSLGMLTFGAVMAAAELASSASASSTAPFAVFPALILGLGAPMLASRLLRACPPGELYCMNTIYTFNDGTQPEYYKRCVDTATADELRHRQIS